MNSPRQAFRPDWSRIFLDTALDQALSNLPVKNGKCLNVGCGTEGRYRELLSGFEVDGVDIANPQNKSMPWRYHRCDASRLPFVDAEFDLAVAIESFEHIENNAKAMQEVARSLKPGGWLVITTPTHWTWQFEFGRHGPHYYDKAALQKLLEDSAFEVHACTACGGGGILAGQSAEILAVADWLSSPAQEVVDDHRYSVAADVFLFKVYRSPSGVPAHELAHGRQKVEGLS